MTFGAKVAEAHIGGAWHTLRLVSPVGGGASRVRARLEPLGTAARLRRALTAFGIGTVVLLVLLPIPGLHLGGVLVFIVAVVYAGTQARRTTILRDVIGPCPSCGTEQSFFLGTGLRGVQWPVMLHCAGPCGKSLRLEGPGE